jgi:hypothetical protein
LFGSEIIDTAIGLVFVFLLVSMLVTIVNELISAMLLSRAKWLRFGIARMIGSDWATHLYAHPLIEGTAASGKQTAITEDRAWRGSGPSYLTSRSFADVLLHLVVEKDARLPRVADAVRAALRETAASDVPTLVAAIRDAVARVDSAAADRRIVDELADAILAKAGAGPTYTVATAIADIESLVNAMPSRYLAGAIDRLPDSAKIKKTLSLLLHEAGGDLERFKESIEVWFNSTMDRVSGWYKRRSQWVAAALGVIAAIGLNVDAIAVVDYLQTHAGVRDAIVAKAKAYGAVVPPKKAASGAADDESAQFAEAKREFDKTTADLASLDLPIGWKGDALPASRWPREIGAHWLGWLITALAATLGAPFWFDTLNRIISIRSAGKPPEEQPRAPKAMPLPLGPGEAPEEAQVLAAIRPAS